MRNGNSGKNTGYFPGGYYFYEKKFMAEIVWQGQKVLLSFGGVYQCTKVYLNGEPLDFEPYGYTGFALDLSEHLRYGEENLIRVEVDNTGQANSRWYSGKRRVLILKKAGFNAIRSAHNPISEELLDACDKYGMYVMDEFTDMWYEHKNRYDYACYFEEYYEKDLTAMVQKDFSHPSVIIYSIGNEVTETK